MAKLRGSINLRSFITVICTVSCLFLSACSNQVSSPNKKTKKLSAGENSVISTNPSSGLVLQTVAPNPFNSNILNLVGDGSGDIGRYCIATQSGGNTSYSCTCSYKYTRANGSTIDWIDTNVLYREEDMLQCSRTLIHADAVTVTVRIHLVNSDSASNEIQVQYQTVFGGDTSNALNMVDVKRYQCRDAVFAPLPLMTTGGGGKPVYDPFLSDDPEISYPLNFYYTNKGAALSSFVANPDTTPTSVSVGGSSVNVGWFCPSDTEYTHEQRDLNLFSLKPITSFSLNSPPVNSYDDAYTATLWDEMGTVGTGGPSSRMAEPDENAAHFKEKNLRSDFALSRKPSGVFSLPVQAYVAPNTINSRLSNIDGGNLEPIGYGAVPTPKGDDQEACPSPDEAAIPSGYHWVKVWLARASLETRKTPVADSFAQGLAIYQMDKDFPDNSNGDDSPFMSFACNVTWTGTYDDQRFRYLGPHGACAYPDPTFPVNTNVSYNNSYAQSLIKGTLAARQGKADQWRLSTPAEFADPIRPIRANFYELFEWVMGFWDTSTNAPYTETDFQADGMADAFLNNPNGAIPHSDVSYTPLETNSRYDYLFVVTPTNIHTKHMLYPNTPEYENYGKFFIPYRIKNSQYFDTAPCDPTTPEDCPETSKIHYDIKLHGVQYHGDEPNPITDPGRLPVFPVCALQKDI